MPRGYRGEGHMLGTASQLHEFPDPLRCQLQLIKPSRRWLDAKRCLCVHAMGRTRFSQAADWTMRAIHEKAMLVGWCQLHQPTAAEGCLQLAIYKPTASACSSTLAGCCDCLHCTQHFIFLPFAYPAFAFLCPLSCCSPSHRGYPPTYSTPCRYIPNISNT